MKRGTIVKGGAAIVLLGLGGFGVWILTLPPAAAAPTAPPIDSVEAQATVDRLKPPKRQRPVIAVMGFNDATETTDYLVPTGIIPDRTLDRPPDERLLPAFGTARPVEVLDEALAAIGERYGPRTASV